MAQKREKEEAELKVPENLSLCTPPITTPHPELSGEDGQTANSSRLPNSSDPKHSGTVNLGSSLARSPDRSNPIPHVPTEEKPQEDVMEERIKRRREVNRCFGCRRKVGLMGFRCRCGELFCSEHRYSDRHDCTFDYKAAGREAIARENPVVRPPKILKV